MVLLLLIFSPLWGFQTPYLSLHFQEMLLQFCMRKSKFWVLLVVFSHANGAFGQADLLTQIPGLGRRKGLEKHGHER